MLPPERPPVESVISGDPSTNGHKAESISLEDIMPDFDAPDPPPNTDAELEEFWELDRF
jgi:hypothetical protein